MLISKLFNLRLIGIAILTAVLIIVSGPNHSTLAQGETGRIIGSGVKIIGNQYEISNVTYNLSGDGNPTTLDQLWLDVHTVTGSSSALREVHVKLSSNSDAWFSCNQEMGTRWLCDTGSPPVYVTDMDELSVVVVE